MIYHIWYLTPPAPWGLTGVCGSCVQSAVCCLLVCTRQRVKDSARHRRYKTQTVPTTVSQTIQDTDGYKTKTVQDTEEDTNGTNHRWSDESRHWRYETKMVQDTDGTTLSIHKRYIPQVASRFQTLTIRDKDVARHRRYKTQTVQTTGSQTIQDSDGTRQKRYTTRTVQDTNSKNPK